MKLLLGSLAMASLLTAPARAETAGPTDAEVRRAIDDGLKYLATTQARNGHWIADGGVYPVAMTGLAGMALLMDGNTTVQGRYAKNVQNAVSFLLDQAQPSGLIGDHVRDSRYMYGHGFSMLFLAEVYGEEEDARRRKQIGEVLARAVAFSGRAQTKEGGWGYVSAREGRGFDEGSVTITQMQSLRAARDAGVAVPKDIIAKGIQYIERCTDKEGGVRYSLQVSGGARPPITAAAVACLYSGGEYENPLVARLIAFADKTLSPTIRTQGYGHWHYAHYYYAQVVYRQGDEKWRPYRRDLFRVLLDQQGPDGSWNEGYIGAVYTTVLNLAILQLDAGVLPIYQR